ncbi:DUF3320 domain-containing protein [Actinoplanes derwentensis]|uniref:Part of AAA domain-containing protein n=1 Tax=Actinoplanes derwentensis TaxID=113562 RepID=A0A1H2DF96_9ACTN|nr:DUF3320 domain-containing protein [Actinoplanes derwentensis]GID84997.1 hypothetical protein Ade03nite_39210 [Actinoplanes derwentensis]SDT81264.1 Part of AAA domain-containing protein [Actinoplanes derwentensis]
MGPEDAQGHGGPDDDVRAMLTAWRDGIVEPGGGNRLINLPRGGPDLVEIVAPDPDGVLEALRHGRDCTLSGSGGRGSRGRVLRTDLPDGVLQLLLRRMRRHAQQEQADRGVDVLHLAVGLLHWQETGGAGWSSPLLLIPVELVALGPGDPPRLRAGSGDPMVNPALTARLARHGVTLPEADDLATLDIAGLTARITAAVAGHDDWRVAPIAVLARFDPAAEATRRDLTENEDRIAAHPVVRALAEADGTAGAFVFAPITPDEIDVLASPDDVPLVLDADAAQRACVAAACEGHSFVVDGPPGTGKSQTIANMIGALTHAGKRVLFVSEKASALDTVQRRLAAVGLGNYLLDLHGSRASRKQVAAALASALEAVPLPAPGLDADSRDVLRNRREQLNAYAEAVNERREPLARSLHDVIGRFSRLAATPEAPAPAFPAATLTGDMLDRIRDAAARLEHAWRPATERSGFRWREVAEREPLAEVLAEATIALEDLATATAGHAPIAAAFHLRLPADAAQLAEIAEHASQRPPGVADQWLSAISLRPVRQAAEELAQRLEVSRRAAAAVRKRAGVAWEVLAGPMDLDALPEPPRLDPPAVQLGPLTGAEAKALADRFTGDADELEQQQHHLDRATTRLGLPDVITFSDVELVTLVAELGARTDKPERAWFSPGAQSAVHAAAGTLRLHVEAVSTARAEAQEIFTDAVLTEPVEDLAERFTNVHRGARKLLAPHRRDKEAVAGLIRPEATVDEAIAELGLAVAWRRAHEGLIAAERQHAGLLGPYWTRLGTDFPAIGRALHTAAEVLRVTPPEALGPVVEYVCAPHPDGELHRTVTEARDVFRHWRSTLRPEPDPAGRPELGHGTVQHAVDWMRAQVPPLRAAAAALRQLGDAVGRDLNVAEAAGVVEVRQGVIAAEQAFDTATGTFESTLGPVFQGRGTDLRTLEDAIEWTAHARTLRSGVDAVLTGEQAQAMAEGHPAPVMTAEIEAWQTARQRVIDAFGPARQVRLATALDRYETGRDLLRDLFEDESGQREWFDYLAARGELAEYGLDTAVDFCADHGMDVTKLGDVLERAASRAWIDAVLATDERLQPLASAARDELIAEFRSLDAELLQDAAGTVIEALNARRPTVIDIGEPAVIHAEGHKPHGHLPVRDQLAAAWDTVAALKPCLFMPPAEVSRLLPDRAAFDVVVIDEASRMTPAAAAACAYRGTSLVIVGDDAQLPPAGDQPSVLVVANDCGAFTRLALTNHYRSRHESLIAFADQAFYQGRLFTFPSAHAPGPDLGVDLHPAAPADEAALVADRVLHHLTNRPSLSLGVVTLTAAHADEIAAAVETALAGRPDLEGFLGDFVVEGAAAAQGDERDVIILATGPDLGAAGGPTGARRLDVAVTRARQKVEVVSSISTADRDEPGGEGERRLAAYLEYAARGGPVSVPARPTALEESIHEILTGWGYVVEYLPIGLGIRQSGALVLGIRCDGPGRQLSPAARDRDRLHDQILHSLGWQLHRVWSVAWYIDRETEQSRLRVAVENALAAPDVFADLPDESLTSRPAQPPEWALPYTKASVEPLTTGRLDDEGARRMLIRTVERIAEAEGPVHVATLTRRIREAWGISRLTPQIRAAVDAAINESRAGFDGTFVTAAGSPIPAVRVPGDGVNRKPDQISDAELQLALEYLVLDAGLVEGDDLLAAAGRLFGWSGSRTGPARLAAMLDDLVSAGRLIAHRNGLIAAPADDLLDLPDPATLPRRTSNGLRIEVNQ